MSVHFHRKAFLLFVFVAVGGSVDGFGALGLLGARGLLRFGVVDEPRQLSVVGERAEQRNDQRNVVVPPTHVLFAPSRASIFLLRLTPIRQITRRANDEREKWRTTSANSSAR